MMTNNEITPKKALEILQKLASLDTLQMNLTSHLAVQESLKVIGEIVNKEEPDKTDLKSV